jgi:nucleotide-binding universal stress UspA family protein
VPFTVLLCTDGSELANRALAEGLAVLAPPDRVVVAMAIDAFDATLVVGTGMAGGVMTADAAEQQHRALVDAAQSSLGAACGALGLPQAETTVVVGSAGPALCELAASLPASVLVMGTRGRGGFRRAVLGSVSDHVVRHAPCPVVITGPRAES